MAQGYTTKIIKEEPGVKLVLTMSEAKKLIDLLPDDYQYGGILAAVQEGYDDARREAMS